MSVRFSPGRIVATPGVLEALARTGESPGAFLSKHLRGEWGELCPEDQSANEKALQVGSRLLSAYRLIDGTKIWIVTEADRSSTCILLPEE